MVIRNVFELISRLFYFYLISSITLLIEDNWLFDYLKNGTVSIGHAKCFCCLHGSQSVTPVYC